MLSHTGVCQYSGPVWAQWLEVRQFILSFLINLKVDAELFSSAGL